MNPQTQLEVRRVLQVVDDLLEDLAILATLPPYLSSLPAKDMQHLLDAFHDEEGAHEVQQQLTEHYDLERRLESAASDMSADDIEDLHFSTRSLVDTMRYAGYPNKYTPAAPPSSNVSNYRDIVTTLRSLLSDRLNTTVEDDVMKFAILNDTVNREKNASADVQALSREYANEKESRRVEVERRNVTIRKLEEELATVKESAATERDQFQRISREHQDSDKQRYENEIADLQTKVEELEQELRNTETKCVNDEAAARQARSRKETALSQIIQHYDQEMTSSTAKIQELQGEIDTDREELTKVEGELDKLLGDKESYEAEMRLEDQRKTHSIIISARQQECAKIVQAFFRAHALRVAMANKGKKKGKKGK